MSAKPRRHWVARLGKALTVKELAEVTGLKPKTVQKRLQRGTDLFKPIQRGNWEYHGL